jgi:hypothetical protein
MIRRTAKGVDFLITRPAHVLVGSLSIIWQLASGLDHYAAMAASTILTFALSLETGVLKSKNGRDLRVVRSELSEVDDLETKISGNRCLHSITKGS